MENWKKPAIEGGAHPCLCCGVIASVFPMDYRIAVGFGYAGLTRDGDHVWQEEGQEYDECMSGEQAEALALEDPDHDWRIVIDGPLSGRTYQRHGPGQWVLIEKNEGFA